MENTYLLSTDHLEKVLWFRDKEDFKVAMNYIATIAATRQAVAVLAFILMSNHVHFVLQGRREDIVAFLNEFKRCYSIYYRNKYGVAEFLKGNGVHIEQVTSLEEAIEKAIAYVIDNPVAANICAHPCQYPWGTGNLYFNPQIRTGGIIGALSERARLKTLHSKCDKVPADWVLDPDGYISPVNYVRIDTVESIFKTPKRMDFFIRNSSKAKRVFESGCGLPSFQDQTVLIGIPDLIRSMFQKLRITDLSQKELSELAKQLQFRYNSDATQIARVCGVSYEDAAKLLDKFRI